ncbi:hydrogenase nickel incorporation protein HypB [Legionella israelensis]|uniref:Hydrogenase maturation factor HypB n=1 Tax=Legionella israelensis TaxID=454 RepID=A0A0W0V1X6_9GAMM|nr:hydrogenase nickel incorporation protein HypB [Legionella israelensis]KTD14114.1 hydrogenase nickel incorporation protein HypB [Legionella israelensis]QBS10321.1 hydrogenase accessory protein HypB [Legionella israelensis]SCY34643.1 Hydrogenase nickel incorporation protein HypB [Legionella israelensis DSM 19235]STX59922.1 hydrogenase expression/formation protein HypB [Legionella israelensis]
MCGICGCSDHIHDQDVNEIHHHQSDRNIIVVEEDLLAKNKQYAIKNRAHFQQKNIIALNLMSSPGAGKTTLLGKTFQSLKKYKRMAVIVGDQQTDEDAAKLKECGAQALQINTGRVCHLDAHMIGHAVEELSIQDNTLLFIENVGNLVCPASFDLGETHKIVLLSITEGDNKPLKYPDMFRGADLVLITKMDLLPYVQFDLDQCEDYIRRINQKVRILHLASTSDQGIHDWHQWLHVACNLSDLNCHPKRF